MTMNIVISVITITRFPVPRTRYVEQHLYYCIPLFPILAFSPPVTCVPSSTKKQSATKTSGFVGDFTYCQPFKVAKPKVSLFDGISPSGAVPKLLSRSTAAQAKPAAAARRHCALPADDAVRAAEGRRRGCGRLCDRPLRLHGQPRKGQSSPPPAQKIILERF